MLDAGTESLPPLAQIFEAAYQRDFQVVGVLGTVVGEPSFHEAPDTLIGVQLGSVAREVHKVEPRISGHKLCKVLPLMNARPVQKDDDGTWQVAQQVAEEAAHIHPVDVALVEPVVQTQALTLRAYGDRRDGRHFVAPEAVREQRCSPAGSPCPDHRGQHQEAGFVEEDDVGAQPRGVFFTDAHRLRFHRLMAVSSRSLARRSGFWCVQPSCFINRPM